MNSAFASCLVEDYHPPHRGLALPDPDDRHVLDLIGLNDRLIYACVQQIADSRTNPPDSGSDVLAQLERCGLIESAAYLRLG